MKETHVRSLAKGVSWRMAGTLVTMLIIYYVTGNLKLTLGAGAFEVVAKTLAYYFHERAWARITWGRTEVSGDQGLKSLN